MSTLARTSIWATAWAIFARVLRTLTGIVTLVILSRFLTPSEYGVAALVIFVTSIATALMDFGTRVALVQRKEITYIQQVSVFWCNMALSCAIALGVYIFAEDIAGLMGSAELARLLPWITPVFLLGALQSLPLTMLERRSAFGKIAQIEILSAVIAAVSAIAMALAGFGVEALIVQQLMLITIATLGYNWLARWAPSWKFSWAELRPLLGYGGYVMGTGILQIISIQVERPIVANNLSSTDLGHLSVGQQISQTPIRVIGAMTRKVMFPIMATIQDDDHRVRRGTIEMQYGLAVILAPVCLGLWALSDVIVALLLAPEWAPAAVVLAYGSLLAFTTLFADVNMVLLSSQGRARFQFYWAAFDVLIRVSLLLLIVPYGLEAILAGQLALTAFLVATSMVIAHRLVGQPLSPRLQVTVRPILSASFMAITLVACNQTFMGFGSGWFAEASWCACLVALGAVLYVSGQLLIDRTRFVQLGMRMISLRKGGKA